MKSAPDSAKLHIVTPHPPEPKPHPPAPRLRGLAWLALLGALAASACADASGSITGAALDVPDCAGLGKPKRFEPFTMDLGALSVHESGGVSTLRMASRPGDLLDADQLGLTIYDVASLRARIKAEGEVPIQLVVGHTDSDTFTAVDFETGLMTFVFGQRCGPTTASLAGVGTLVMTAYGDKDEDNVSGRFDIDILDRRTGKTLGEKIHGDFDFVVSTSSPNTAFAPRDY